MRPRSTTTDNSRRSIHHDDKGHESAAEDRVGRRVAGRSRQPAEEGKGRGVEALGSTWTFLDLTPLGRQENWEDSPKGRPQTPPYEWWRRHDEYKESATG